MEPVCRGKPSGDGDEKRDSERRCEDIGPMRETREYATREKIFLFDIYLASIRGHETAIAKYNTTFISSKRTSYLLKQIWYHAKY